MARDIEAAKCKNCGKLSYPTHFYCPKCGKTRFEAVPIAGAGTLLTWTRVYALPLDYAELFITLGIVEMDMGVRATGRLDIAEPQNGARVHASLGTVREIGGKLPINPSGGLKARGHPVGNTGVSQIVELVRQLRNEAGDYQVPKKPKHGFAVNFGGFGNNVVATVLARGA